MADPEQDGSLVSVDIFVDLSERVQNELTGIYRDFDFHSRSCDRPLRDKNKFLPAWGWR